MSPYTFPDRRAAGEALAGQLARYAGRSDVVVLALPRGGVPIGFEIARALHAPLAKSDAIANASRFLADVLERMRLAPVSILKVADSKGKVLQEKMLYEFYGYPPDYLERYRAAIEKVTPADVARVAAKYVHKDQLAVVVVGKAADFDRPLSSFGRVAWDPARSSRIAIGAFSGWARLARRTMKVCSRAYWPPRQAWLALSVKVLVFLARLRD